MNNYEKIIFAKKKEYLLRDIANFSNGKGHEQVVEENGKYTLITSKAISTDMNICRHTNKNLSPLYKNDIALVMSDLPNGKALAKCFFVNEDDKYTLNQRICRIWVKDESIVYPKYLYYVLNRNKQLLDYDNKIDQTNLKKDNILDIDVKLPDIEIQRETVSLLEKFEELLTNLNNEFYYREKQLKYWREKMFSTSSNYLKLKELADINIGLTYTPNYVDEGIKFISSQNISKDYLDLDNIKYITPEEYNSASNSSKPKKGDIMFVRVGSNLGHPVIYNLDDDLCIFVSIGFLRLKTDNITAKYMRHWMNSSHFMNQVKQKTNNAPKANLNSTWLKEFEVPVPSINEQNEIVNILDAFDNLLNDSKYGLSKEIELMDKQYEFYKNMLLNTEEEYND